MESEINRCLDEGKNASENQTDQLEFCYEIRNFSSLTETVYPKWLKSDFNVEENAKDFEKYFTFACFPHGRKPADVGYVSVAFEVKPHLGKIGMVDFSCKTIFFLVDSKNNVKCSQSFIEKFKMDELKHLIDPFFIGIDRFIERTTLLESEEFLPDDKLTLGCRLLLSRPSDISYENNIPNKKSLDMMLDALFIKNKQDGKVSYAFKVPKIFDENKTWEKAIWEILFERSEYFKYVRMVAWEEKRDKLLPFEPREYKAFVNMLHSFMTRNFNHVANMREMCDLYVLAIGYHVQILIMKCSNYIRRHLTTGTAAEILALSDSYNDTDLIKYSTKFVLKNWIEVIATDGWNLLMDERPDLTEKIVKMIYKTFILW